LLASSFSCSCATGGSSARITTIQKSKNSPSIRNIGLPNGDPRRLGRPEHPCEEPLSMKETDG